MKVLLVTEYYPPNVFGGGEISTQILAETLKKEGLEIDVLTSRTPNLTDHEEKEGINVYRRLKTGKNPSSLIENLKRSIFLQKSIKKEIKILNKNKNYDIIHFLNTTSIPEFKLNIKGKKIATYNSYTNFCPKRNLFFKDKKACSGANFSKCMGCISHSNYVGKLRLPTYLKYNPLFWFYIYKKYKSSNKGLKNIDHHIAISNYIKGLLITNRTKEEEISVIPNLVEFNDKNENFEINEKGFIITYAGALEKIKGVDKLAKAITELNDPEIKLLIFGEGSELNNLKKIDNPNIFYYGKIAHKYIGSIYKQSNLIVLPTLWPEPLARNLLEALYYGKPIIATKTGGTNDTIIDGKNGFLINPEIKEIKEKIKILKNDLELCKEMGEEGQKIYNTRFNNKNVVKKIIEVYKNEK